MREAAVRFELPPHLHLLRNNYAKDYTSSTDVRDETRRSSLCRLRFPCSPCIDEASALRINYESLAMTVDWVSYFGTDASSK